MGIYRAIKNFGESLGLKRTKTVYTIERKNEYGKSGPDPRGFSTERFGLNPELCNATISNV